LAASISRKDEDIQNQTSTSSTAIPLAFGGKSPVNFAGFLRVRENWKKSGNLCGQGKVRGKYYFLKVRENDCGSCRLQIFYFCVSKY